MALPTEIWLSVGERLEYNTNDLKNLVKTSRTFNRVFTPLLYAHRKIKVNFDSEPEQLHKPLPAAFGYIRYLDLTLTVQPLPTDHGLLRNTDQVITVWWQQYVAKSQDLLRSKSHIGFISAIVKKMPDLYSFRWRNGGYGGDDIWPVYTCLPVALSLLKNYECLRQLFIHLPDLRFFYQNPIEDGFISLRGFHNLSVLEVFGLTSDRSLGKSAYDRNGMLLIKSIASLLHDCPRLIKFGIGMHHGPNSPDMQSAYHTEIEQLHFFKKLCLEYSSKTEAAPLSLEVLRLGFGMFIPPWENEVTSDNYLARFVDLAKLQTFHIYNGIVIFNGRQGLVPEDVEVDWTLLEVVSLRQLSITVLNDDALTFLNFGARCVEELIVTHKYSPRNEWSHRQYLEIATALTTVVTWEKDSRRLEERVRTIEFEIDRVDSLVLERTVLDRLGDISQIKSLSICLDFSQQWSKFQAHLKDLPSLIELRLNSKTGQLLQYPSHESSLWPGISDSKDLAFHYAQLLMSVCPSLKRIRIGQWGWEVNIQPDREIPVTDLHERIVLREMQQSEMMAVELFAINSTVNVSGLPDLERWDKVLSDDECENWECEGEDLARAWKVLHFETNSYE